MALNQSSSSSVLGSAVQQIEEKLASAEIKFMQWAPKMDLVAAVAIDQNDVILYCLHQLKKIWRFPAPEEGASPLDLAWEPSGKCEYIMYYMIHLSNPTTPVAQFLHDCLLRRQKA